jgi:cholesterol oxidase
VVLAAGALIPLRLLFGSSAPAGGLAPMPALGRGFFANGDLIGAWISPAVSASHSAPVHGALTVAGHENEPIFVGGLPRYVAAAFVRRNVSRVLCACAQIDSGKATVSLVKGRLRSDYDYRKEPIYDALRESFRIVGEHYGVRMHLLRKPLTVHMGGGARIGANSEEGVIDHRGEVHGNPGLFVADAAALPAPPGGPPAVTIAAWAHNVADGMASRS